MGFEAVAVGNDDARIWILVERSIFVSSVHCLRSRLKYSSFVSPCSGKPGVNYMVLILNELTWLPFDWCPTSAFPTWEQYRKMGEKRKMVTFRMT